MKFDDIQSKYISYPVGDGGGRVFRGPVIIVASGVLDQRRRELLREVANFAKTNNVNRSALMQ